MKNLLIILLCSVLIVSCDRDDVPDKSFVLDSSAMIYIKPANTLHHVGTAMRSAMYDTVHLSNLEIVKRATTMRFFNDRISESNIAAGFAGKDTISETPSFLRYGTDIITNDGFGNPYLVPDFVYAYDCVIEIFRSNNDIDTIAYIPNECFTNAKNGIIEALESKDTAQVYIIFKEAFKFIPITGKEYRDLKSQNLQ